MNKLFLPIVFMLGYMNQLSAQWYNLNSTTTTYLYSTYFANYDTGYAVGGGLNSSVFLKTTNGGVNWNVITNTQTKWLYDLVFLNDTVGIACGYDGAMYKTTDAGLSWSAKPSQTTAWLYAIAKRPDGTLYATGQDGALIRSTNAGDNWNSVVSNTAQTMLDIQFFDNNYGAAVGYSGEMIYTTDGGNNWAVKLMGTPGNITGVWMLSPDTMWTCGLQGKIYKTTNAGASFTFSTNGINDLHSIFFTDHLNGYLAGNQKIYQTNNGGASWSEMTPYPTSNAMKDIFISPDNRVMYAVGDNGAIIKNVNTIGIENIQKEPLVLFPNPTTGELTIPVAGTYSVTVLDITGKTAQRADFTNVNSGHLSLQELPDGPYMVQLLNQGKLSLARIVVKH